MADRNTRIRASQLRDDDLRPDDLASTNSPTDQQLPAFDQATAKFTWVTVSGGNVVKYTQSFVNANLSSGILTVTHSLGSKYVQVSVYDNNDKKIVPDEITLVNTNSLTIDMGAFIPISGTWNLVILG